LTKHLGVQYLYEDLANGEPLDNNLKTTLSFTDSGILMSMSKDWQSQLSEVCIEGDSHRVMVLIQAIPDQESNAVKVLRNFARQFEFDEILELLDATLTQFKNV
jgi:hypothetical protein